MTSGPGNSFLVTSGRVAGMAVVTVRGDLDRHTTVDLDRHLDQFDATSDAVVIDMSGVTFCDSAGVASLIRLVVRGIVVRVVGSPRVLRTIELAGVGDLLTIVGSVDDATGAATS